MKKINFLMLCFMSCFLQVMTSPEDELYKIFCEENQSEDEINDEIKQTIYLRFLYQKEDLKHKEYIKVKEDVKKFNTYENTLSWFVKYIYASQSQVEKYKACRKNYNVKAFEDARIAKIKYDHGNNSWLANIVLYFNILDLRTDNSMDNYANSFKKHDLLQFESAVAYKDFIKPYLCDKISKEDSQAFLENLKDDKSYAFKYGTSFKGKEESEAIRALGYTPDKTIDKKYDITDRQYLRYCSNRYDLNCEALLANQQNKNPYKDDVTTNDNWLKMMLKDRGLVEE